MSWRDVIETAAPTAVLRTGASRAALDRIRASLAVSLPRELRQLLTETNGVTIDDLDAVWAAGDIVRRNREMREVVGSTGEYQPFDGLLFIGEGAEGDLFPRLLGRFRGVRTSGLLEHEVGRPSFALEV